MYQQCCTDLKTPQSRHIPDCTHNCILATVFQLLQSHAFLHSISSVVYDLLTQDSGPGLLSVHPIAAYLCTACPCWSADAVAAVSANCSYLWQHAIASSEHLLSADLGYPHDAELLDAAEVLTCKGCAGDIMQAPSHHCLNATCHACVLPTSMQAM